MQVKTIQEIKNTEDIKDDIFLEKIEELNNSLTEYFSKAFFIDNALTRQLVSFQANKSRTYYRWYKYKEAFSADLVEYLFRKYGVTKGKILDPFAGAGTSLFASSSLGYTSEGIEVLPVGQKIIEANVLVRGAKKQKIISGLEKWLLQKPWNAEGEISDFEVLRITDGAYPLKTHHKIGRYLNDIEHECLEIKEILFFALLCVLESISYTRKDGQYLRWDYRSGRRKGKNTFDKGQILSFDEAILKKLNEIKNDMHLRDDKNDLFSLLQEDIQAGGVNLLKGSCLDVLPRLESRAYSGIITSPPYCNRYDYTRTYALEHALLGVNEIELVSLRQAMLSCTVENKAKGLIDLNHKWQTAINICDSLPLLQQILNYLDYKKEKKELNNNGIARMVRGYFYEMACVIQECYRILDKGGIMFMVNDNVRYAGAAISVDLILSKIAEDIGFKIEKVLILPQGKGNSSQQMGKHGRERLRKCIYVWKKNLTNVV
ncbi:MAG: site-specific DNA-methyltransferase [Calothrix sp. MO_192.B10]|nr:site-specific DNA-methyltransferase [Calothrix sp. MO_192.B10]